MVAILKAVGKLPKLLAPRCYGCGAHPIAILPQIQAKFTALNV